MSSEEQGRNYSKPENSLKRKELFGIPQSIVKDFCFSQTHRKDFPALGSKWRPTVEKGGTT